MNRHLLAARSDAAGDDPAHAQRDAGASEAGDVVEAGLRPALALDAEPRAELFLPGDLEPAVLGGVGDDDLGQVVGQVGVLVAGGEHEHRDLLAGARGSGRGEHAGDGQQQRTTRNGACGG